MKIDKSFFQAQYELARQSRMILFGYCKTFSPEDFLRENSSFGRGGSVRNLLVHIANTYEFWIIKNVLKKNIAFTEYSTINTMDEIEELFEAIDMEVFDFMKKYEDLKFDFLKLKVKRMERSLTALELFTHVITHEFHHKGQILSLSRHLGYTPIDTDIIR